MIALARSEILRVRSRRVLWVLSIVAVVGILVGVTIGAVNSDPSAAAAGGAMELRDGRALLEGLSTMVIVLGVVLGASLVGADWASGTFTTLLTWESRRFRVVLVRLLVVAAAVVIATLAIQAVFVVAFRVAVAARGSSAGAPSDWWQQMAGVALRVSLGSAGLAVISGSIATIGRSTVLAVGSLFGYLVIVEGFLAGLMGGIERWLLVRALTIVVSNQPSLGFDEATGQMTTTSVAQGRVIVATYVVVLAALAVLATQRRDVQ